MKKFIKKLKEAIKHLNPKVQNIEAQENQSIEPKKEIQNIEEQENQNVEPQKILLQSEINLMAIKNIEKEKKVFIIGMPKTGTTSMEILLEKLGYRVCRGYWDNKDTNFLQACYNFGAVDEILNITNYYDAFADAPWGGTEIYKKLVELYPKAYFIHTLREPKKWYNSLINMYLMFDNNISTTLETIRSFGSYGNYLFMKKIFGIETLENSEEKITNYFINYNREVKAFFENSKYNYLNLDITCDEDALEKIANFLKNKNVLEVGLPHMNKGEYKEKSSIK